MGLEQRPLNLYMADKGTGKPGRQGQEQGKGKRKKEGRKGREKQTATNPTQLLNQQDGLTGKTPSRDDRRWHEHGEPGSGIVATQKSVLERGGLRSLRGSSSVPKEIHEHFQK